MKVPLTISKELTGVLKNHLADYNEMCESNIKLTDKVINQLVVNMLSDTDLEGDNLFEEYYPE